MRLYLDVVDGPHKGEKFSLSERTSFGRNGSTIQLNDPKLSSVHMFFDFSPETGWYIEDNKSRNGVWINGLKEVKMVLKNGDAIQIGDTKFICRLLDSAAFSFSDRFLVWIETLYKMVKNSKSPLKEVNPEIRLNVVQGVQYGKNWDIFYGPRKAGRDSDDICFYDEAAPREAFEIRIKGKYAYFYTKNENQVRINDQSMKEKQFTPGDEISFGDTRIKVEINEGHGFGD